MLVALIVVALGASGCRSVVYTALFSPSEQRVYREIDGTELRVQIFRPEAPLAQPAPAILLFHGGGWAVGSPRLFYPHAEHYARLGLVALSASYRTRLADGSTAHDSVADARAALRWIASEADTLGIDPQRIALGGGSAGGHLAAAAALLEPSVPVRALVLFNPAVDTSFDSVPDSWERIRVPLFEDRGREISPLHLVRADAPPAVLFHGTDDRVVPIDHSRSFCAEMEAAGNDCELHEFEGAGHGFFNWGFGRFDEVHGKSRHFLQRTGVLPRLAPPAIPVLLQMR